MTIEFHPKQKAPDPSGSGAFAWLVGFEPALRAKSLRWSDFRGEGHES
jgi:hypothetical protein